MLFWLVLAVQVRANPAESENYKGKRSSSASGQRSRRPSSDKVEDGKWNVRLSAFQKLIFIKAFEEERVKKCILHHYYLLLQMQLSVVVKTPDSQSGKSGSIPGASDGEPNRNW